MIDVLYIEEEIAGHPRVREIGERLPRAARVPCGRYGEVFNRRAQSFRLQKRRPALILARKFDRHVLPTPPGYGIGTRCNYYFSHLLNCPYDCRYCFLQGMYRSAHYVLFVNYEDFEAAVDERLTAAAGEPCTFFSGYDSDSLALEGLSGFAAHFLPFFRRRPRAWLELRTKSVRLGPLRSSEPFERCVVAFSFTPEEAWRALEHRTPAVERRIAAMAELQRLGWPVGLRLDPLIYLRHYRRAYEELLAALFERVRPETLHSASLGPFRLPRDYHRNLLRQYPEEPLLAAPLAERDGMVSYRRDLEEELVGTCSELLLGHLPPERLFRCSP